LKVKCDEALSDLAFHCSLRPYNAASTRCGGIPRARSAASPASCARRWVPVLSYPQFLRLSLDCHGCECSTPPPPARPSLSTVAPPAPPPNSVSDPDLPRSAGAVWKWHTPTPSPRRWQLRSVHPQFVFPFQRVLRSHRPVLNPRSRQICPAQAITIEAEEREDGSRRTTRQGGHPEQALDRL
jgi:hypothetical protein